MKGLREKLRVFRKPYREACGFFEGDAMRVVGTRTQLSNVPTKLLFSHVAAPGEHPERTMRGDRKGKGHAKASAAAADAARHEAHVGLFIDWKHQRTWLSTFVDGAWRQRGCEARRLPKRERFVRPRPLPWLTARRS